MSDAPQLDPRNGAALRTALVQKLHANVPEWSENDSNGQADQVSAALVNIFARFGEIVVQRLNRAPEKNFLAFLDLLGVAREAPRPARVPLTFTLAQGGTVDAVVPAGTQAAAAPGEGEKDPVIFETERELTVVAASLQSVISTDGARDMVADRGSLLEPSADVGQRVFSGNRANEHVLYVGHRDHFSYPQIQALILDVVVHGTFSADPFNLQWEAWSGTAWTPLSPTDTTNKLQQSGTLTFAAPASIPELAVNGVSNRWLRCRLLTPIAPGSKPSLGMTRAGLLPLLDAVRVRAQLQRSGLKPIALIAANAQTDPTRPFQPFGSKPSVGDAFFLGSDEVFSKPGAAVSVVVTVVNPPPANSFPDLQLTWQTWSGSDWVTLGVSTTSNAGTAPFNDGTLALTRSQSVAFTLPTTLAPTTVNGVSSYWVRALITAGNYGVDARYVEITPNTTPKTYNFFPPTFAPPTVGALTIGYQLTTPLAPAQDVMAYNNLAFENFNDALAGANSITPFHGLDDLPPALYAAFVLPPTRTSFPNRAVTVYQAPQPLQYGARATPLHPDFSIGTATAGQTFVHRLTLKNDGDETTLYKLSMIGGAWPQVVDPQEKTLTPGQVVQVTVTVTVPNAATLGTAPISDRCCLQLRTQDGAVYPVQIETRVGAVAARQRRIRWEYWDGDSWSALAAVDGSERMARPGTLEFLGPSDFAITSLFGVEAYWLRALFDAGDDTFEPRLRALIPNTTFAAQSITLANEILGSSDASEQQRFNAIHSPVLDAQQLEVREPGPLSDDDIASIEEQSGSNAVTPAGDAFGNDVWVRWVEVTDLYGSSPQDRHYMIDHLAGEVAFGDGVRGRIPPRGASNIRLARYRTGGGDAGNRAANTIVQLKTTVPFIDKVFNTEAAAGGFAAESSASLIERAPRTLRHGGRAVTAVDYEDLTRLASPEVARAKCVPLRRLQDDPLGSAQSPGAVSIIVVPGDAVAKPVPTLELLARAEDFLRERQAANAEVAFVGPLYMRVDVAVEVALASLEGASQIEQAIRAQLGAFLHPLTGGRDGKGWDFGREPQRSDLIAVVSGVAGVDHVRQLSLSEVEDVPGIKATGRFLVYSGNHQVKLTFLDE